MRPLKIGQFMVVIGTLCLCGFGCSQQQLYKGPERPPSEVVTVVLAGHWFFQGASFESIVVDGKRVPLDNVSYVLPGTYDVYFDVLCQGGFATFVGSFAAAAGDTVTYTIHPGSLYYVGNGYGPDFSYTITGADSGKGNYNHSCAACHGPSGKGDGWAGKPLHPPPANLATALKGKTDDYIKEVIKEGGIHAAASDLTDDQIKSLVDYIKHL